jgi:hypothetical protein
MKQLSVYTLALLLVIGTTSALASGRDHRRHSNDRHNTHRSHYNYGNHYQSHYRHGYSRHHGSSHYRHGFYRPSFYGHSYLGAALIGSAFSYSLYHQHNGAVCYDNHGSDIRGSDRYEPRASYSEVVGCHRIERLPDGTQRRVDVPRSQCE